MFVSTFTNQNRKFVYGCVETYRYGYQGSEKDGEINAGAYTTEFRMLDVRLGRWFMVDPLSDASRNPYNSMGNNPISRTDVLGLKDCMERTDPSACYNFGGSNSSYTAIAPFSTGVPEPNLFSWLSLAEFKAPASSYQELEKRREAAIVNGPYNGWGIQRIENGAGTNVNIDFYGVEVDVLPTINGKQLTKEELQEYIRTHLNDFCDSKVSEFSAYSEADEKKWQSDDPLNSVMHFEINSGAPTLIQIATGGNPDDLTVIMTEYDTDHWIFSTVQSPADGQHPVAGNRKFGFTTQPDGKLIFYTQGVDRAYGKLDAWIQDRVFAGGHKKWLRYQRKLAKFINKNGGKATIRAPFSERLSWKIFKNYLNR